MKKLVFVFACLLSACRTTYQAPIDFEYQEIQTSFFKIALWQKISDKNAPFKVYIEGDGYAFNANGHPTSDPTPHSAFLRQIAFNDPSPNVVYLGRPCQYIKDEKCEKKYWTTARFAPEVITSEADALKKTVNTNDVVLIGYSGGAQVAGLISVLHPEIKVQKIITIAGNLDHQTWTRQLHLAPLDESLSLIDYKEDFLKIPQTHYVGTADKVIPAEITKSFIGKSAPVIEVKNAKHGQGFENIYNQIWH